MNLQHTEAIETRLRWLRWGQGPGRQQFFQQGFNKIVETYLDTLATGDTFFMNGNFCSWPGGNPHQ